MTTRTVQGSRNQSFSEGVLEDILRHTNDQTYDIFFIPGTDESTHNYHITCAHFATISKDPSYLGRCLIQAKFQLQFPDSNVFPNLQPFQISRTPKQQ